MKSAFHCALLCLCMVGQIEAAGVDVRLSGLEDEQEEAVRARLGLITQAREDIAAARVRILYSAADEEIRAALEPFGYYNAQIESALDELDGERFRATFNVSRGEPVRIIRSSVEVVGDAAGLPAVGAALEAFEPRPGEPLDHEAYERSKRRISAALRAAGYFRSELVRHQVSVTRADNTAVIDLRWEPGERYRFGAVHFPEDTQFSTDFLARHVPWPDGAHYSDERVLELQQRLVDADYFSVVSVQPLVDEAQDGVVPIEVLLLPNKRSVYTAGVYVSTDTGVGTRLGFERRWLNRHGHKLDMGLEYSQRLQQYELGYVIPRPGLKNKQYRFGAAYIDEETATSTSRTLRIAAMETRERWRGFNRSLGLQYLAGDFEIAEEQRTSNVLFIDSALTRKRADDLLFPRRGYSLLYGVRLAAEGVLSDTSLAQVRASGKWIGTLDEDSRLILRADLGAMAVGNFDALPPELRFFAGGDRSVRGFDYEAIGETNEAGGVLGGEYLVAGSAEYEHYFLENWGAAIFVDAGDAFASEFHANVGAGIGVRWKSPVGVVRLDIARPVVTELVESWRIHLVIGPDL